MSSTRPKSALGHEDNRKLVCAPCGKKISLTQVRPVSEKDINLIRKYINNDFDIKNPVYPSGICNTCRIYLSKALKTGNTSKLPTMLNYEDIVLPRPTRSNDPDFACKCNICLTATSKAKNKRMTGKIDKDSGLFGSADLEKLPDKEPQKKKKTSLTICNSCKQEIGKGINHTCTIASSSNNIVAHTNSIPSTQQEQVITSMIKSKIEECGAEGNKVTLSTKGTKATVVLNPDKEQQIMFTHEALDDLQIFLNNASNKQMRHLTQWLRVHCGRKSVIPGYANHVSINGKKLEDLYEITEDVFDIGDGKKIKRPVVYAKAEEVVNTVSEARNYLGSTTVKVMVDGGQGFLKICLILLPENYDPDLDKGCFHEHTENEDNYKDNDYEGVKRSSYAEGGGIGNFKLTSVKRLILLALVPSVKETHFNMSILFKLTELNNISYIFVSDFKLLLICLGCQTATSSYPCPYCLVPLRQITTSVDDKGEDQSPETWGERTFGSLKESHRKYQEIYNSERRLAKNCESTVEASLIEEAGDVKVIDKCPPEELHVLMGFTNHTFWNGYVHVVGGLENALRFPKALHVISKDYHGSVFEGNACKAMLKKADKMLDKEVLGGVSPFVVMPYVRTYKAMNQLVDNCFGSKVVDKDEVVKLLKELIVSYMDLGLTVTLKMHILFYHLLPALCNPVLKGRGLGIVSGQAGESVHREFKLYWNKYKINSLSNPLYAQHLKNAVVEFSSKHM